MQQGHTPGTAVLAFSGGLDTSFCVVWLREQGWRVITVTADTGGFDPGELQQLEARAMELGAARHITRDVRSELFDDHLRYLLFANARRGATYPLSVSAERICQAQHVARQALSLGADAVAHGSTGAGNDQVRFDVVLSALAPELALLTPVRSLGLSRAAEAAYLKERGFTVSEQVEKYSYNLGMWGTSIGGVETLNSWDSLPAEAYPGYGQQPAAPACTLTIGFSQGEPAALNGTNLDPVELIDQLNQLGVQYGIGTGIHLGDTIVGIKGRVGFSAPAAHILIEAHRELEKLTLSAKQLFWKETLGNLYGTLVHEAQHLDPLCRDLEAFLTSSQATVTGEVRVCLSQGYCQIEGSDSPYSLLGGAAADYGEVSRAWDAADAAGFSKLYGMQQSLCLKVRAAQAGVQE